MSMPVYKQEVVLIPNFICLTSEFLINHGLSFLLTFLYIFYGNFDSLFTTVCLLFVCLSMRQKARLSLKVMGWSHGPSILSRLIFFLNHDLNCNKRLNTFFMLIAGSVFF